MKKAFSLFLIVVALTALLAGCKKGKDYKWPQTELAKMIPAPNSTIEYLSDRSDSISARTINVSSDEYYRYVSECKSSGFTIEAEEESDAYEAFNESGYHLELRLSSDSSMWINLDAPKKMAEFSWPDSSAGRMVPKPKSTFGKIEWEHNDSFVIYVGNMSKNDYSAYAQECKNAGFSVDYRSGDTYYYADNADGYSLSVRYEGNNTIFIRLDPPEKTDEETSTAVTSAATADPDGDTAAEPAIDPGTTASPEVSSIVGYSDKTYYVGDEIPANGYVITCTKTKYGMRFIVFESEEAYKSFQRADQFTMGEFGAAIEQNAWADFDLEQDEQAFISLREGNVILLHEGECEFTRFDPSESNTVYSGIYVIGEDIAANALSIKCVTDYMGITVFESKDTYLDYHKSSRFSYGEEADAIETYSATNDFIFKGYDTYVKLKDGMILMVTDGVGESTVDNGPVIN